MTELSLDCPACGKKFRVNFAIKPKQVVCPQCKAKVNTSPEQVPAGAATKLPETPSAPAAATLPSNKEGAAAPQPAPASAAASTIPAPAASAPASPDQAAPKSAPSPAPKKTSQAPAKPRRLPTLLKSEEEEFAGWTYDREAERAQGGLQKADVLGVVWIGGILLMLGFILFNLAKRKAWHGSQLAGEGMMGVGAFGMVMAAALYLKWKRKPSGTLCAQCHGALGLAHTIPTARDCQVRKYRCGVSKHAYLFEPAPSGKVWEIHKKWHVCKACKRYFLAEQESRDFVGVAQSDMEKREALYAEAVAAAASAKPPVPAAGSAPATPDAAEKPATQTPAPTEKPALPPATPASGDKPASA